MQYNSAEWTKYESSTRVSAHFRCIKASDHPDGLGTLRARPRYLFVAPRPIADSGSGYLEHGSRNHQWGERQVSEATRGWPDTADRLDYWTCLKMFGSRRERSVSMRR